MINKNLLKSSYGAVPEITAPREMTHTSHELWFYPLRVRAIAALELGSVRAFLGKCRWVR
jgi:hypothetical protein